MDFLNTDKIMFNVTMSKYLGLYQLLDPETVKIKGYNIYQVVFVFFVLFASLVSLILFTNGLFYWTNHGIESLTYLGESETLLFTCYKAFMLVINARKIREILLITRFDFISFDNERDESLLELWRNRIIRITKGYALLFFSICIIFVLTPMVFSRRMNTMKTYYGSTDTYRINALNLYLPLSAETYNTNFNIMYFIEVSCMFIFVLFLVIFDMLLTTFCLVYSCQLERVNLAFESAGLKCVSEDRITNKDYGENKLSGHLHNDYKTYNDLITTIINHQSILKNLDKFYSIFQHLLLLQIVMTSFPITTIWYSVVKYFIYEKEDAASSETVLRLVLVIPVILCQLAITCYLFEFLQNKKESVTFALYSSNWTEMDLRCKKLILLSMYVTNAHKQKLKFSQLKIVNLELFFGTMRICYSVVSVILNTR